MIQNFFKLIYSRKILASFSRKRQISQTIEIKINSFPNKAKNQTNWIKKFNNIISQHNYKFQRIFYDPQNIFYVLLFNIIFSNLFLHFKNKNIKNENWNFHGNLNFSRPVFRATLKRLKNCFREYWERLQNFQENSLIFSDFSFFYF